MIRKENKRSPGAHGAAGVRIQERLRSRAAGAAAALMSLVAVLCAGCAEDPTEQPRGAQGGTGDYALLQLTVPGAAAGTRAAMTPAQEGGIAIEDTHIVLCQKWDAGWYLNRVIALAECTVTESEKPDANGYTTYNIEVPFETGTKGSKYCLGVIAGFDGGKAALEAAVNPFYGNELDAADPLRDIRTSLVATAAGKWPSGTAFPMWGESDEFTQVPNGSIGTLSLMRATARVDVGVKFIKNGDKYNLNDMQAEGLYNEGKGTYFALASVRVYGTMKGGTYGSAENVYGSITSEPSAATVPNTDVGKFGLEDLKYEYSEGTGTGTGTDNDFTDSTPADGGTWSDKEKSARRMLTRACYVFETKNEGAEFDAAACVIVGGYYGEDKTPTYYRIDFATTNIVNGVQNKPQPGNRFDLLRNKVYVVNITSVSGPGKNSPEEALKSDETKMTAEVQEWNQNDKVGDITTDGVYTLSVDKSELQYYTDGTPEEIVVKTDYDGVLGSGWTLEAEAEKADEQQKFENALLLYDSKGNQIPVADFAGSKGTTTLRIGMRELPDAGGKTAYLNGKLIVKSGRMQVQILIRQTSQDLLRILFEPEEMVFGRGNADAAENAAFTQPVKITVTTKKDYVLTITGKDANGATYTQTICNTQDHTQEDKVARDDRFEILFKREDNNGGDTNYSYLLLPKYFEQDRAFTFDVTASLPGFNDVAPAKERFMVYQLKDGMRWMVNEGAGYVVTPNPWHVIFSNQAHAGTRLNIEVKPDVTVSRPWWFSKGDDMTELPEWFMAGNADLIGKNLENVYNDANGGVRIKLDAYTELGRRSVTLKVEEMTGGLPTSDSKLIITQRGKTPALEPRLAQFTTDSPKHSFTRTQELDLEKGKKEIYTLDHGTGPGAGTYTFNVWASTYWKMFWNIEDQTQHDLSMNLLVKPDFVPTTTIRPKQYADGVEETWDGIFTVNVPPVPTVPFDNSGAETTEDPTVELGGRRTVTLELRNDSPKLTSEDVEDYARELRITRDLPAYTYIDLWPFENPDGQPANLDNMVYDNMPQPYDDAKFRVYTNAPVTLKLQQKKATESAYWGEDSVVLTPWTGYQRLDRLFKEIPGVMDKADMDPNKPATMYKLTATYKQYDKAKGENVTRDTTRIAYTGYHMVMPTVEGIPQNASIFASTARELTFDFSKSLFVTRKVRITKDKYYTHYKPVEDNGMADYEPTEYLTGDQGVEISSKSGLKEDMQVKVQLAANTHPNFLYKIGVEFFDEASQTWKEDPSAAPELYQDGTGVNGYIVYYERKNAAGSTKDNFMLEGKTTSTWRDKHGLDYAPATVFYANYNSAWEKTVEDAKTVKACDENARTNSANCDVEYIPSLRFIGTDAANKEQSWVAEKRACTCPHETGQTNAPAWIWVHEPGRTYQQYPAFGKLNYARCNVCNKNENINTLMHGTSADIFRQSRPDLAPLPTTWKHIPYTKYPDNSRAYSFAVNGYYVMPANNTKYMNWYFTNIAVDARIAYVEKLDDEIPIVRKVTTD